jgi:excisionase family DNA binding protein
MIAPGAELASLVIFAARDDAALAAEFAAILRPHLQREEPAASGWMASREAAAYLGLTLAALHRLTAARAVPFEQDAPGGKCWFNRADLDTWRRGGRVRSHPHGAA